VRTAKSGGWKSELPASLAEKIETAWGPLMGYLQYELQFPPRYRDLDPTALVRSGV